MELKARTKLACKIARLDPARFNEAVHFNKYGCAPSTTAGSARIFYQDDIVALFIYSQLMEEGISSDRAGWLACEALSKFSGRPDIDVVTHMKTLTGFSSTFTGEIKSDEHYGGFPTKALWFSFNIKDIRDHVRRCLEDEYSTLGED